MRAAVLGMLAILAQTSAAQAEKRVALVVGNAAYVNYGKLPNPTNDADQVTKALQSADFEVIEANDLTREDLERSVRRFMGELAGADVGLFYYSGHAVQVDGRNYLIPVDANLKGAYDLDFEAFSLDNVQRYMEQRTKLRLIFLDACRDNPFQGQEFSAANSKTRSLATRGLALMRADVGTLIAFSTDPGQTALDGKTGDMSPFSSAFVAHAMTPGLEIRRMLSLVRSDVLKATSNGQRPWENSSLVADFYFQPPRPEPLVKDMYRADVAAGATPVDVAAPAPEQPAGGALKVALEELPEAGQILLNGQPVEKDRTLTVEEFSKLQFLPTGIAAGNVQMLRYRVDDDWGNHKSGLVVLAIVPAGGAPAASTAVKTDDPALVSLAGLIAETVGVKRIIEVGVGPVDLALAVPAAPSAASPDGLRIEVRKTPPLGELRLGTRVIKAGQRVEVGDLKGLTYRPHADAGERDSKIEVAVMKPSGETVRQITLNLHIKENDCDLLAAEPLDLQGVSKGVAPNEIKPEKALPACLKAITEHPDVPRFFFQLGRVQLARGDFKQGAELLRSAADRGHIRALATLSGLLLRGANGKVDLAGGIKLLEQGAALGDPYALHSLGYRLYEGEGINQDRKRGLTMLLQAAEMGHTYAMNGLGTIFDTGDGVKADPVRAAGFFKTSSERHDIYGYNSLGFTYLEGKLGKPDYKQALALFIKAYEGGHPYAANNIGRMYYNGQGVKKDPGQAAFWYAISADRGDGFAANNLAYILLHGEAGKPDAAKAARYYAQAIAIENPEPRAAAELELLAIPEKNQLAAIDLVLKELGYPTAAKKGTLDAKTLKDLAKAGIPAPKKTTETLVALAKLKWLKSKPRFDLF